MCLKFTASEFSVYINACETVSKRFHSILPYFIYKKIANSLSLNDSYPYFCDFLALKEETNDDFDDEKIIG